MTLYLIVPEVINLTSVIKRYSPWNANCNFPISSKEKKTKYIKTNNNMQNE